MTSPILILAFSCSLLLWPISQSGAETRSVHAGGTLPVGPMPEHEAMKPDQTVNADSLASPEPDAVTVDGTTSDSWALPGVDRSTPFYREVPSISGRYSFGGQTFLPYLGAGFGSGYASQLDRSLNSGLSTTVEPGLRNHLGQSLSPNEFQMGIRIPF